MKHLLFVLMLVSMVVVAAPHKNNGVQVQEYVYDFAKDGGAQGEIELSAKSGSVDLPSGAVVKAVSMKVVTAFTSGGSATLSWGNEDDADGYSGAAVAVASLTDRALFNGWDNAAALLWDDTNDHQLYVDVNDADSGKFEVNIATADMTAGKAVFLVEYYYPSLD